MRTHEENSGIGYIVVTIVGLIALVCGCGRTDLGDLVVADQPATQTATPTVPDTSSATATQTQTSAPTTTSTVTATVTATATPTATATATATATVTAVFKILSVSVDKVDALGNPAEDVRSFGIQFSSPAKDVDLVIATKDSGVFHLEQVKGVIQGSLYISPGNWTEKLKSNTTYQWSVTANAATEVVGSLSDGIGGEFTTSVCFAGETRH